MNPQLLFPSIKKQSFLLQLIVFVFCSFFHLASFSCQAHGDLSKRIEKKTKEIEIHPDSANLYIERGFLYQQHLEFKAALNDYHKSQQLGADLAIIEHRKAEVYFALHQVDSAISSAKIYAKLKPNDPKNIHLMGRLMFASNNYDQAVLYYNKLIEEPAHTSTDIFLEFIDLLSLANTNPLDSMETLFRVSFEHLGQNNFLLQKKKLDMLIQYHSTNDKILAQFDVLIEMQRYPSFWLYQKALFLYQKALILDAEKCVYEALQAFQKMSKLKQSTNANSQLLNALFVLKNKLENE